MPYDSLDFPSVPMSSLETSQTQDSRINEGSDATLESNPGKPTFLERGWENLKALFRPLIQGALDLKRTEPNASDLEKMGISDPETQRMVLDAYTDHLANRKAREKVDQILELSRGI